MTPEQAALVERAMSAASGIEALRKDMADLASERRQLIRQVVEELGFEGAREALDMKRQTLAGLLPPARRRPSGPPLLPLLQAGLLEPNEILTINRRGGRVLVAWLNPDGSIRLGQDQTAPSYATPSRAAGELMNVKAVDGYLRFKVPRLGGRTLMDLRKQLAQAA